MLYPSAGGQTLERLRRELKLVRELRHPGILRIYDIGEADGLLYLVSELLAGEPLHRRLAREGTLPLSEIVRILEGLFDALAAAHDAGVVHRDVKPANIYLARDDSGAERVVLLDFGLARDVEQGGLTTVGRFVGTPEFSAPEQIRGEGEIGPAADLYAVGVTAWQMTTGVPPFTGGSEVSVMNAHLSEPLPAPNRELRRVPAVLRALIARLLAKEPGARPKSAHVARAWLARRGAFVTLVARLSLALRRPRRAALLSGLAGLLLVGVAGTLWALEPVRVGWNGPNVALTTRIGLQIVKGPFDREVALVELEEDDAWPWRPAWVVLMPGELQFSLAAENARILEPDIHRIGMPFMAPRPALDARSLIDYRSTPFHDVGGGWLRPRQLVPLERLRREGEPYAALLTTHTPSYPSMLHIFAGISGSAAYSHPGHLRELYPVRTGPERDLALLATGLNNWAGPRPILALLPASVQIQGQAPPYRASVSHVRRAGGWYTFLPYRSTDRESAIAFEGEVFRIRSGGGIDLRYELATGVPLDAAVRGGLSVEAWLARREAVDAGLFDAAMLAQAGRPAEGAALLERVASVRESPAELRSIPWYIAATYRMRSGEHALALANMRQALELEEPARYRLLKSELLLRLGHHEELAERLDEWGQREESMMHAYEHMLLNVLAGSPVDSERFLASWPPAQRYNLWPKLIRMVLAYHAEDWPVLEETMVAEYIEDNPPWDVHHFWFAQSLLERPDLDPHQALEHLSEDALFFDSGLGVPVACARLRALALRDGAAPPAARIAARDELAAFDERAVWDLHALVMLPLARRNVAEAERLLRSNE